MSLADRRSSSHRRLFDRLGELLAVGGDPSAWITAGICVVLDAAVFLALLRAGADIAAAQVAGAVCAGTAFAAMPRLRTQRRVDLKPRPGWFMLFVAILALYLQGGLLALCLQPWGLSAPWAIIVAAVPIILGAAAAMMLWSVAERTEQAAARRHQALAGALAAYLIVLRVIHAGVPDLLPEEAYYWNYAQHPALGYLDHPPMVAWLIGAATAVFGDSEFAVRFGAMLCAALASFFVWRLTCNLYSSRAGLGALLLMQALPFCFATGLIMTPDAPLLASWAAALHFLERALIAGRAAAWWGVGIAFGIGLSSKYSIGLLALAVLVHLLTDASVRKWLLRWEPAAAGLLALLLFSPVILWNAQHDWASFAFQTAGRLADRPQFALPKLLGASLLLATPLGLMVAVRFVLGLRGGPAREAAPAGARLLAFCTAVPWAVYAVFSLRHEVKFDWTGPVWLAVVPLFAAQWARDPRTSVAGSQRGWWTTIIVCTLIFGAGLQYLSLGLPGLSFSQRTLLLPVGWRELGPAVQSLAAAELDDGLPPIVVGMDRYATSSELAFYAGRAGLPPDTIGGAHLFGERGLMYELWSPARRWTGRSLLLVAWKSQDLDGAQIIACSSTRDPIRTGMLMRDGKPIRAFYTRVVHGYRPPPSAG